MVIAEDQDDLNYMIWKLVEEYKVIGLNVNIEKSEYMTMRKGQEGLELGSKNISAYLVFNPKASTEPHAYACIVFYTVYAQVYETHSNGSSERLKMRGSFTQ